MRLFAAARLVASGNARNSASALQAHVDVERRARPAAEHGIEHLGGHREPAGAFQVGGAQALDQIVVNLLDERIPLGGYGRCLSPLAGDRAISTHAASTACSISADRSRSSRRSIAMRRTPSAARRRPNGSRVPVGFWPMRENARERVEPVRE